MQRLSVSLNDVFIVLCEWLPVLMSVFSWRVPYALIMLLVSVASGLSKDARFELIKKRRMGAK